METISVMDRGYKKVLYYGRKEDEGKRRQNCERPAKIERSKPYIVRDGITVRLDKMA